ncbi:DUF4160 domain-containing protein [Patescibacteria group bacterium]|nr:DUF4160 domain-containing protein [Patescibacteria group bacterium]
MGERKALGFIFVTYINDHDPYHVHVCKDGRELFRFDIVNQKSLEKGIRITGKVRKALKQVGYLK